MMSRRASLASHILGGGTLIGFVDRCSFDVITRQYIREWQFMPAFVGKLLVLKGLGRVRTKHELVNLAKVPDLLPVCRETGGRLLAGRCTKSGQYHT
jgi:hypothetical protein